MKELNNYFRYKCEKGLKAQGLSDKQNYIDRLNYEVETIIQLNFAGYFLIVQDFIQWAKNNNIIIGAGRGSINGSLVAFVLNITEIDPIKWNLIFERFINPTRVSLPDADIDVEKRYRDKLIEYVTNKYGTDKVAHIGTLGKLRAKAAVRTICRVLNHPYGMGDRLANLLLAPVHGKPQSLTLSIEKVPELQAIYQSKSPEADILKWALKVEEAVSNVGSHAAGIVISNTALTDNVPLFINKHHEITTQWEMNGVEKIGLIKFDFLGLDALEKMHKCIELIKQRQNKDIDISISSLDLKDDKIYSELRAGNTLGIFQLEGGQGMKELLVKMRPTCLDDIIATTAIFRPGPLSQNYLSSYIQIRSGLEKPRYLIPELEPILKSTDGWLILQEQVMEIAKQLCGYSSAESDNLRKAIGKKDDKLMSQHEQQFKNGWLKNGYPKDKADILWKDICSCADYMFCKSHACSYSHISFQTAYLKTYYPIEYMCSIMICQQDKHDDIIKCLTECKRLGIKTLPPDINKSQMSFSIDEKNNILFGLSPVKNLGESVKEILEERRLGGEYKSFKDFCERVDLGKINKLKVESLIKAGAFDSFGLNRATLLNAASKVWSYREEYKRYESKLTTWEKKIVACEARLHEIEANPNKKILKPLKQPEKPILPLFPEFERLEELSQHEISIIEHELLGFFVSYHPLDSIDISKHGNLQSILQVNDLLSKMETQFVAIITYVDEITTKNKKKMCFITLEDLTGTIEATCFPKTYEQYSSNIKENNIVIVSGTTELIESDDGKLTKIHVRKVELYDPAKIKEFIKPAIEVPVKDINKLTSYILLHPGKQTVEVVLKLSSTKINIGKFLIDDCQKLIKGLH